MAKRLKKKQSNGIIAIIMIAIFVFAIINAFKMADINSINDLESILLDIDNQENIFTLMIIGIISIFTFLFNPFTMGIIFYKIINFFYNLSKLKYKIHPKFNLQYFRDDLKEISPALVSYLAYLELNLDRDVPAHILKLVLDGYIKEENNKYFITDKNQDILKSSDRVLIKYVESNFSDSKYLKEYEQCVIKDAISEGYIKENNSSKFWLKVLMFPFALAFISWMFIPFMGYLLEKSVITSVILLVVFIILEVTSIFGVPIAIYMLILTTLRKDSCSRTKKGNTLLEQIMGLKNYLNDFSNLDKSSLDDLVLREYYLVYSIVLEINKEIDDEVLLKIHNQMKS